jgi:hypothetical protein
VYLRSQEIETRLHPNNYKRVEGFKICRTWIPITRFSHPFNADSDTGKAGIVGNIVLQIKERGVRCNVGCLGADIGSAL